MRELTPLSTLESLRKEAKAWLKAVRTGDRDACERLRAVLPESPATPGLRHIQLALAREFGLAGWGLLRDALEERALARRDCGELVALLLHSAKPWDSDKPGAARIFARVPELSRYGLHAAALCGDLEEVERRLARDPAAARAKGGPLEWEPLQYLAYGRLPGAESHAIQIARRLLDAGADPGASFDDGWGNPFTLLNGVIGQGEQDRSEHPRAMQLARLFIDAGKDAFDTQVNYDTSLGPDDTRWLELLWLHSDPAKWQQRIYARGLASTLDYLLGNAVDRRHLRRAEWLLAHGADPNGAHGYSLQPVMLHAQLYGGAEMRALLERHGGRLKELEAEEAFMAACLAGDTGVMRHLAAQQPALLHQPHFMIEAAQRDLDEVVTLLLELGTPADIAPDDRKRALHWCGQCGSVKVGRRLIAAGADIDARGSSYKGTPLGFALHFRQQGMIDLLAPLSRDVLGLAKGSRFERIEVVLREDPTLAAARDPNGATVLFCLPDDEDAALRMAELLLSLGVDPHAKNKEGDNPAQAARKRGLEDAAQAIEAAVSS